MAQAGDEFKTCDAIVNEMQLMVQAQARAESDHNNQVAGNVALGVAGVFLIVPWFFMDTGNAATVEERAAQARYQRLNQMQIDRKCATTATQSAPAGTLPIGTAVTQVGVAPAAPQSIQLTATESPKADAVLTPTQKMEHLDGMLKKGLITQDEYNTKKQEVLKTI